MSATPEVIAHYKLLEQIGVGGLGDVYRARDTRLGRTVALKVSDAHGLAGDAGCREALLSRAREISKLSHPSIATLFDVGEADDRVYLAFEFVQGRSLRAVIGSHPLNPRRAVAFGIQLADALADAHAEALVHGDIRPDTIAVTNKERAKLLDFGLSAFTRGGAARTPTRAAASAEQRRAVTPYLAPEEAEGGPSEASDIFALGCVLFEMLTGRQAVGAGAGRAAPRPSSFNRAVPAELDAMVARAVAVDPAQRYRSAATLAAELRGVGAILDVRTAAHEARVDHEEAPSLLWRTLPWLLALAVLGAAAGGLWVWRDEARALWRRWFGPSPQAMSVVTGRIVPRPGLPAPDVQGAPTAEEFRPASR